MSHPNLSDCFSRYNLLARLLDLFQDIFVGHRTCDGYLLLFERNVKLGYTAFGLCFLEDTGDGAGATRARHSNVEFVSMDGRHVSGRGLRMLGAVRLRY